MSRISKHKKTISYAMEPRMRRIMEKLKEELNDDYFTLTEEEKMEVSNHIALTVINTTIQILNGYERDELPEIMDLAITNLTSLEMKFAEMEMYAQSQMMFDAIIKIHNDIHELTKNNKDGKITN